ATLSNDASALEAGLHEARAHFERGVALFEKDDFVGALEAFDLADRARHLAAIIYNIARARESLGQAQAAFEAYEAYIAEAGAQGEYLAAATVALTNLKARATGLRIESDPPGATVRVDGVPLREKTPTSVWVFRGRHRVDVELGSWITGLDVAAEGNGASQTVRVERPEPSPPGPEVPAVTSVREYNELTAGLGFSLNYSALVVKADRESPSTEGKYRNTSLRFGVAIELGYALSPRAVMQLRGDCGLGATEKALFSLGMVSLSFAHRAAQSWWLSAGGIVGSIDKELGATYSPLFGAREDDSIVLGSDMAVGPVIGATLVLDDDDNGEWTLAINPSLLLGTGQAQSTLFVPLAIGRKWY
ncbi:MAG: PEGA domain-containing protein, partial [Polyangiaceae bacterium]|nr:PEGA domain-containing protein [Polyangiaceae bacterium]